MNIENFILAVIFIIFVVFLFIYLIESYRTKNTTQKYMIQDSKYVYVLKGNNKWLRYSKTTGMWTILADSPY